MADRADLGSWVSQHGSQLLTPKGHFHYTEMLVSYQGADPPRRLVECPNNVAPRRRRESLSRRSTSSDEVYRWARRRPQSSPPIHPGPYRATRVSPWRSCSPCLHGVRSETSTATYRS